MKTILIISTCPFIGGGERFIETTLLPLGEDYHIVGLVMNEQLAAKIPDCLLFKRKNLLFQVAESKLAIERIHPDLIVLNGGSALYMAPYLKGQKVAIRHTTNEAVSGTLKRGLYRMLLRQTYLNVDVTIHVSNYAARQQHIGKREVILNGIKIRPPRTAFYEGVSGPLRVLYCGRMEPEKGVRTLVEAVKSYPEQHIALDLVGTGSLLPWLESLHVPNIHVHGFQQDVAPFYERADVYAQLSDFENCPLSVLDAMNHSLPSLVYPNGGLCEMIGSYEEGVYCRPQKESVEAQLGHFMRNPEQLREMGLKAHEKCAAIYDIEQAKLRYKQLFDSLLHENRD